MKTEVKTILVLLLAQFNVIAMAEDRTIAAGGSITEIMYALGLEDQIIAVDSSSYFPPQVQDKTQVGYFRRLSAEGVLSTRPTRLVAANGAGPDAALEQIRAAGVEVKMFTQEIYTLAAWKNYLLEIGRYFNAETAAQTIIDRVEHNLNELTAESNQKSVVFLMDVGDRGPVAAGKNTVPDMLFHLAGFNNIVTEYEGFKPYSTEQLIKIQPEVVVMPSHVVEKMGGKKKICELEIMVMATTRHGCDVLVLDALLALGYGTRIDEAVSILLHHE